MVSVHTVCFDKADGSVSHPRTCHFAHLLLCCADVSASSHCGVCTAASQAVNNAPHSPRGADPTTLSHTHTHTPLDTCFIPHLPTSVIPLYLFLLDIVAFAFRRGASSTEAWRTLRHGSVRTHILRRVHCCRCLPGAEHLDDCIAADRPLTFILLGQLYLKRGSLVAVSTHVCHGL